MRSERLRAEGVEVASDGYASRWDDVLIPQLDAGTKAIEADLTGKGGSELVARGGAKPKFRAAHSSAALAANAFGPFLGDYAEVPLGGRV